MKCTNNNIHKRTSVTKPAIKRKSVPVFQNIMLFLIADALPDLKNLTSTRWFIPGGGGRDVVDMLMMSSAPTQFAVKGRQEHHQEP